MFLNQLRLTFHLNFLLYSLAAPSHLGGIRIFQHLRELRLLALQLRISTDMLMVDEDVRNASLVGHLLKGVLKRGAIICDFNQSLCRC